jgi:V/A-type H+-transporting ATPase subunit F
MRYFVIGSEDAVLGFQMVGVSGVVVKKADEAAEVFSQVLQKEDIGVILLTEDVASLMRETVNEYIFAHEFPLICEIPGPAGRDPLRIALRDLAVKAMGINL